MTLYVDSSALAKRYVAEADSYTAEAILLGDPEWVSGNHTFVEVVLALSRRLEDADVGPAVAGFESDWRRTLVVALDDAVCRRAAEIGRVTGSRTLDALQPGGGRARRRPIAPARHIRPAARPGRPGPRVRRHRRLTSPGG